MLIRGLQIPFERMSEGFLAGNGNPFRAGGDSLKTGIAYSMKVGEDGINDAYSESKLVNSRKLIVRSIEAKIQILDKRYIR